MTTTPPKKPSASIKAARESDHRLVTDIDGKGVWGWRLRSPTPRFHLMSYWAPGPPRFVWLEDEQGRRVIEPDRPMPDEVMRAIVWRLTPAERAVVEEAWLSDCFSVWDWLKVEHRGLGWMVSIYGGTPRERLIPLAVVSQGNVVRFDAIRHAIIDTGPPVAVVTTLLDGDFHHQPLRGLIWRNR